ncbi:MAG: hypothetical protein ACOYJA_13105 [Christensenellales bacterium]|jgi:hypothetical protein
MEPRPMGARRMRYELALMAAEEALDWVDEVGCALVGYAADCPSPALRQALGALSAELERERLRLEEESASLRADMARLPPWP